MIKSFLIIFCLVVNIFGQESQQDYQKIMSRYGYEIFRPAVVGFDYFVDYQGIDWRQQLFISVSVQNDFLQFTRNDEKFTTKYQVTLTIRNEQKTILSKTWQHKEQLEDFDKTNSKNDFQIRSYKINLSEENIERLKPGEYELLIEVHDLLSTREYRNKRKLVVDEPEENQKIWFSKIGVFKKRNKIDGSGLRLSTSQNIIEFNTEHKTLVTIKATDYDSLGVNVRLYKKNKTDKTLVSQAFIKRAKNQSGLFTIGYELPDKMLNEGDYLLRFSSSEEQDAFEVEHSFSVIWLSKPLYLYKTDLAVRPMKYLLSKEQIAEVKDLRVEELNDWFNAFWKERDPSPNTTYNELLDIYYQRVTEAVRNYSNRFKEGWQTDRGMVLLLYGEPSEIENRKYSVNSIPHIIWKYKNDEGEQVFTFVDKNKTGIFTLIDEETGQN